MSVIPANPSLFPTGVLWDDDFEDDYNSELCVWPSSLGGQEGGYQVSGNVSFDEAGRVISGDASDFERRKAEIFATCWKQRLGTVLGLEPSHWSGLLREAWASTVRQVTEACLTANETVAVEPDTHFGEPDGPDLTGRYGAHLGATLNVPRSSYYVPTNFRPVSLWMPALPMLNIAGKVITTHTIPASALGHPPGASDVEWQRETVEELVRCFDQKAWLEQSSQRGGYVSEIDDSQRPI